MTKSEKKLAVKISIKGMCINLLLFVIKGITGLIINSVSLMSDAIHSLTDIISTFIVLIGLKISSKPADKKHPYGHERIECIIALFLGVMLFLIGAIIIYEGYQKVYTLKPTKISFDIFNICAMLSAFISILAKEWMYRFTIKCAKKIDSTSMKADAWHHRSDALSSVGSLIGVAGICLGLPSIDIIACFVISVFIFKAAYGICADACKKIVDTSAEEEKLSLIKKEIEKDSNVISIDMIKTRQFGSKLYIDVEVTLDNNLSFTESHNIAHRIHDNLECKFSDVLHCMIHVNPS